VVARGRVDEVARDLHLPAMKALSTKMGGGDV